MFIWGIFNVFQSSSKSLLFHAYLTVIPNPYAIIFVPFLSTWETRALVTMYSVILQFYHINCDHINCNFTVLSHKLCRNTVVPFLADKRNIHASSLLFSFFSLWQGTAFYITINHMYLKNPFLKTFVLISHLCTPFKKECNEFASSVSGAITEFPKVFIGMNVIKKIWIFWVVLTFEQYPTSCACPRRLIKAFSLAFADSVLCRLEPKTSMWHTGFPFWGRICRMPYSRI